VLAPYRHLSDVVYRHLLADFERRLAAPKTDVRRVA
jgi:hypothetical protein